MESGPERVARSQTLLDGIGTGRFDGSALILVAGRKLGHGMISSVYTLCSGDVAFKDVTDRPGKIRLDNGEILTAERCVCGEYYYTDASSREYEEVNGGFRMKQ